jgi:serine/threonine-protein kinase
MPESYEKPYSFSKIASIQETADLPQGFDSGTSALDILARFGLDENEADRFTPPSDLLLGRVIARKYEILELIGAGGMGFVYKARHVELDKLVAIKVLLLDKPLSDIAYKRFEQEAKATGSLDHPNIVRVSDYGQIGEGCPYIVMELLQGEVLDELITLKHGLPVQEVVPVCMQLSRALAHAHTQGVIHRDLKPSNIMLTTDDQAKTQAKIIDFGIAKLSGARSKSVPLTKPGEIFGSPLYMSPEQCMGNSLDQRSDIYSLGCVMYEMLVGRPPFMGDTVLATIYMHVNEPPAPIKEVAANATIPEVLENIIKKCLNKSPDMRFQSAAELLEALQNFEKSYAKTVVVNNAVSALFSRNTSWFKPAIALSFLCLALIIFAVVLHPKFSATIDKHNIGEDSQPLPNRHSHSIKATAK